MADTKISALTAATTPLAGTEVLPIVQSGTTKQVSVANLTAGRAVSGLTFTSTVATGTAPFTVTSTTEVANLTAANATNATNATTASNLKSNATTGVMQIVGPAAASTRVMTIPDANFTAARTDAAQTFSGTQTFAGANIYNVINNTGSPGTNASPSYAGTQFLGYAGALKAQVDGGDCSSSSYRGVYRIQTCDDGSQNMVTRMQFNGSNDITWYTVNLIQGTAGKGINFTANTPAAGMTSQLLNWYEDGTWTPNQGAGLTLVGAFSSTGKYTRIGRQVSISGTVTGATSVAITAAGVITSNLPFTVGTAGHGDATNAAVTASATVICTGTSVTSATAIAATGTVTFSATYFV